MHACTHALRTALCRTATCTHACMHARSTQPHLADEVVLLYGVRDAVRGRAHGLEARQLRIGIAMRARRAASRPRPGMRPPQRLKVRQSHGHAGSTYVEPPACARAERCSGARNGPLAATAARVRMMAPCPSPLEEVPGLGRNMHAWAFGLDGSLGVPLQRRWPMRHPHCVSGGTVQRYAGLLPGPRGPLGTSPHPAAEQ